MNVYWAVGLVQGHIIVRGEVNVSKKVHISELWKDPGHESLGRSSEEKCLLSLIE